MLDKKRVIAKIDKLDGYIDELQEIKPDNFESYKEIKTRRSCERVLQLIIECLIDISKLFVVGLQLGVPSEENDLFGKLCENKIISDEVFNLLKDMRGFRNIIIHEYANIKDELVFEFVSNNLDDFKKIEKEFKTALKTQ